MFNKQLPVKNTYKNTDKNTNMYIYKTPTKHLQKLLEEAYNNTYKNSNINIYKIPTKIPKHSVDLQQHLQIRPTKQLQSKFNCDHEVRKRTRFIFDYRLQKGVGYVHRWQCLLWRICEWKGLNSCTFINSNACSLNNSHVLLCTSNSVIRTSC